MTAPLLDVRNLTTRFDTPRGIVHAVEDVSFTIEAGETMAIVGESGSGKSVTAMSLMRMVRRPGRITAGQIRFHGTDLLDMTDAQMRSVRGSGISLIFQDPMSSLNPAMRIRDQLTETMLAHGKFSSAQARSRSVELMELVGIPSPQARLADYPHSFSGGMRQRVMIAMAVANKPDLIIADEPTTALDVTIQAQVLDLLGVLNRELGTAVILITHNLGVVARSCQRAAVMYAGRIVEQSAVESLFADPRHPYTRDLLAATPRLAASRDLPLVPIAGRPPDLTDPPSGCPFSPRCGLAEDRCHTSHPPRAHADRRSWYCWVTDPEHGHQTRLALPSAPATETSDAPETARARDDEPLLRLEQVGRFFPSKGSGLFRRGRAEGVNAVDDVDLVVHRGETAGLVGESGCGKSTLARVILGILPATSGHVVYDGRDVTHARGAALRRYRRAVQLVFQDPYSSLNPRLTVASILREPLEVHGLARGEAAKARVVQLLELVGLEPSVVSRYPHEFSGGQRQRIAIARALAVEPDLIVCDEAVSALDVSLQAQVVNLLRDLRNRLGLAYLFIGHDIATVRHISDRIVVMYLGEVVEEGPAEEVTARPQHPYTASLLSAVPEPDPAVERSRERIVLTGDVPSPLHPPQGCRFHTRCPIGPGARSDRGICIEQRPKLAPMADGHLAACHFPGELRRAGVDAPTTHADTSSDSRLLDGTVRSST
jgi:peptide/nickel transport system ATP-binding protein